MTGRVQSTASVGGEVDEGDDDADDIANNLRYHAFALIRVCVVTDCARPVSLDPIGDPSGDDEDRHGDITAVAGALSGSTRGRTPSPSSSSVVTCCRRNDDKV